MNKDKIANNQTSLIVVMGVSGSGKSLIASKLSNALAFEFIEADDFHSDESKKSMAANIALTDDIRQFWVDIVCHHLKKNGDKNVVLAFSGLKYKHRQVLRALWFNTQFIWLDGKPDVIKERLKQRKNHFASSAFLSGQLKAMESVKTNENDIIKIDIDNEIEEVFSHCLKVINENNNI
jgi:gluconokinase